MTRTELIQRLRGIFPEMSMVSDEALINYAFDSMLNYQKLGMELTPLTELSEALTQEVVSIPFRSDFGELCGPVNA